MNESLNLQIHLCKISKYALQWQIWKFYPYKISHQHNPAAEFRNSL